MKTPPKNRHAASQPATIASSVVANVNHTNMCREYTAVKINACTTRRRPVSGSGIKPILAKSIWHSTPGSPSATGTVSRGAAATVVGALHAVPVQRTVRHQHAAAGEQITDLDHRQVLADPLPGFHAPSGFCEPTGWSAHD